jgi:hypothetical protein
MTIKRGAPVGGKMRKGGVTHTCMYGHSIMEPNENCKIKRGKGEG